MNPTKEQRQWREANKERIRAYMLKYRSEHKEEIRTQTKRYRMENGEYRAKKREADLLRYHANREKVGAARRARRAAKTRACRFCNTEKIVSEFPNPRSLYCLECAGVHSQHIKDYQRSWREEHSEELAQYSRAHYSANQDRLREQCRQNYQKNKAAYINRARLRQSSLNGTFTQSDIDRLYAVQNGRCAGCRKPLKDNYEIDHVMPVCKGGSNTADNLQLLCLPCNRRKHSKHPDAWAKEIGKLFV